MTNINNVAELEEHLSRPTDADAAAMSALNGDLLILGVGGKMGPSLAGFHRPAQQCRQGSGAIWLSHGESHRND
jgi:hypothetical protein